MKNQEAIRERYMRDPLPIRLGGLAADLARIQSFSDHPAHRDVVMGLIEESRFFIEWTAPDAELEKQVALVELQRQLTRWQHSWPHIWADPARRAAVAEQAGVWAERVLGMSGLL
jgi:hypothetical protein